MTAPSAAGAVVSRRSRRGAVRFLLWSGVGAALFFAAPTWRGQTSIPIAHLVDVLRDLLGGVAGWLVLALATFGLLRSLLAGGWRSSPAQLVLTLVGAAGVVIGVLLAAGIRPGPLGDPRIGDFLWDDLAVPIGMLVPAGGLFLALLAGYGAMEFLGTLLQPVMRPLLRVPGRAALAAVTSAAGSYAMGFLLADRWLREGSVSRREAAIISTGLATVAMPLMVVVAHSLDLMALWGPFLLITLVTTVVVTAISARIPPLSLISDEVAGAALSPASPEAAAAEHELREDLGRLEPQVLSLPEPQASAPQEPQALGRPGRLREAWVRATTTAAEAPPVWRSMATTGHEGLMMASAVLPSLLSVGFLALLLVHRTPVFSLVGWAFTPFAALMGLPEPHQAGMAISVGLAEMVLPAGVIGPQADLLTRLVVGAVSISAIVFFSGHVPALMATSIPVPVPTLLVVWLQRAVLSILVAAPLAHLLLLVV